METLLGSLSAPLYIVVSWLATYAVHSTVLLCTAWGVTRFLLADNPAGRDIIWKSAAVGAVLSSTVVMLALPSPVALVADFLSESSARDSDRAYVADGTSSYSYVVSSGTSDSPASGSMTVVQSADAPPFTVATINADVSESDLQLGGGFAGGIVLAWLLIASGLLIRLERRRIRFLEGIGRRNAVLDGPMHAQLSSLSRLCEVDGVELTSGRISSPVVLNAHEICVPHAAFAELEDDEQRSLVTHEFAHIIRRDPHWLRALHSIERVFFFQPLNRLARKEFEHAAEELCDNWVVERTGEADSLASCLVRVARWVRGDADLGFASIAGRPLRKRIERLVSGQALAGGRGHAVAVGSILTLVLAIAAWGPALSVDEQAPPMPVAPQVHPLVFAYASASPDTLVVHFSRNEKYEFSDDDHMTRVTGFGTVTLRESGVISAISSGGFFAIETEEGGRARKATARPSSPGAIAYEYTEGGMSRSFDSGAQRWFAEATEYFVDRMQDLESRRVTLNLRKEELERVQVELAQERAVQVEQLRRLAEVQSAVQSAVQSEVAMVQSRIVSEQARQQAEIQSAVAEEALVRARMQTEVAMAQGVAREALTTTRREYEAQLRESRMLIEQLQLKIRELEARLERENR